MTIINFELTKDPSAVFKLWRTYLNLAVLQLIGAMALTMTIQPGSGGFLSLSKIVTGSVFLLISLPLIYLLSESWKRPEIASRRANKLASFFQVRRHFVSITLLASVISLTGVFLITLIPEIKEPFTLAIFQRLLVIFIVFSSLAFQTLVAILLLRHGFRFPDFKKMGLFFWGILIGFGLTWIIWLYLNKSIVPAVRQIVGWNDPAAPLLEFQVALSLGFGILMLTLPDIMHRRKKWDAWLSNIKPNRFDLIVCFLIWFAAVIVWQSIPVQPNWFLTNKMAPNREYYPSSDARLYDAAAQSALTGGGFRFDNDTNIRRPLHTMYLTVLHVIGGQDYDTVVFLQIMILAIFPVIIYLLSKSLHHRASGVMASGLVIFREANSLAISGNITTANVKVLMVDLPTTLLLVVFLYLTIIWFKTEPKAMLLAGVSGMVMGLTILIRPETFVILTAVVIVLIAILSETTPGRMRPYLLLLRQLTIFSVGVIIVLAPWIWRNYQKSGLIYLNEPYFRFGIILQRFNPDLIPTPTPNPIRDDNGSQLEPSHPNQINSSQNQAFSFSVAYPLRNLLSITPQVRLHNEKPGPSPTATPMPPQATSTTEVETIAKDYLNKALQNKSEFFLYMLAHYFNSQIQFLLMLPSTFRGFDAFTTFLGNRSVQKLWYDCCSTIGYTRRLPYWPKWQGDLALQSSVPLVLNIFILAVGVQTSWRRQRWLGILPLLCAMIYIAANAFFRNSGGRYLLPVDWVVIVYFSIGTIQIIISLTDYFFEKKFLDHLPMEQSRSGNSSSKMGIIWKSLILAAGFMIISISVPLTERVFPNLYPQERQAQMLATLLDAKKLTPKQQGMLKSFIDQGAAVQAGRILYPQFYPSGVGSLGKEDSPIDPLPFPRLVFNIVSSQSNLVTLPMENKAPIVPNASDGLLISCPDGAPIALAIFDKADRLQSAIFTSPEPNDYSCPLTLPSDSTP